MEFLHFSNTFGYGLLHTFSSDLPSYTKLSGAGPASKVPGNTPVNNKSSSLTTDQLSEYLLSFRDDGGEVFWPEQAKAEAVMLFGNEKSDAQMSKDLAIIYCLYAHFEVNVSGKFSEADDRYAQAVNYLNGNSKQREMLQGIFPMIDNFHKEASENKKCTYGDHCRKLQEKFLLVDGDQKAYERAIKANMAIDTLHIALGARGNDFQST